MTAGSGKKVKVKGIMSPPVTCENGNHGSIRITNLITFFYQMIWANSDKPMLPAKISSGLILGGSNEITTFMDKSPIMCQLQEKAPGSLIKQGAPLSIKRLYNAPADTSSSVQLKLQGQQDLQATIRTMTNALLLPLLYLMIIICNETPTQQVTLPGPPQ